MRTLTVFFLLLVVCAFAGWEKRRESRKGCYPTSRTSNSSTTSNAGQGSQGTTAGPTYVGEGEQCNGSLPPRYATLCRTPFVCVSSSGLPGSSGTCRNTDSSGPHSLQTKVESQASQSSKASTTGPTYVGEGDACNGSLPPQYATLCQAPFVCVSSNGLPGSSGTCRNTASSTPTTTTTTGPAYVGEGEQCNGSLPPRYATLCRSPLTCVSTGGLGSSGVCTNTATSAPTTGPTYVGEGEQCNGSLPPRYATLCRSPLTCVSTGGLGSSGVCTNTATSGLVCAEDVRDCGNGIFVSRDPARNCEFKPCPTASSSCSSESSTSSTHVVTTTAPTAYASASVSP